jgi:hypothetical protein
MERCVLRATLLIEQELGYLRVDPQEDQVARLIKQLRGLGVNVFHHKHQVIVSKEKLVVEESGIVAVRGAP